MPDKPTVEFLFDFISPYAYLAYHGVSEVAARHGAVIRARPILFAALLNHHGHVGPAEIPAKRLYVFKDVLRSAAARNLKLEPPPSHPFNPLPALRLASLEMPEPLRWKLIGRLFELVWAGGGGATDLDRLTRMATELGVEDAVRRIAEPSVKLKVKEATQNAIEKNVFGVPTMLTDDELFWGYDSLDHLDRYLGGADPVSPDLMQRWKHIKPSATRR